MNPVRAILVVAIVSLAGWGGVAPRAQGGGADAAQLRNDAPSGVPEGVELASDRRRTLAQAPGARGEGREGRRGPRDGDGPPPPPGGEPGSDRDPMGPEFMSDIIRVAHDYDPELGNRLEEIRKRNPDRFRQAIGPNNAPNLIRLVYLLRNNPEMYKMRIEEFKLNRESEDIAKQIREGGTDKGKLDKLRQQLRAKITEQFVQRQKIRERELGDLEKRIEDLRKEIRSRKEKQAELIAEREKELIEKPAKVEW